MSREEYYEHLKSGDFGECAFCEWEKWQTVLYKGKKWLWIASLSPYWKYHTMFIPLRHVTDLDDLTKSEMAELMVIKNIAIHQYAEADLRWPDGTPMNVFTYMWRVREGGNDLTFNVKKSMHLHLHMWLEKDGLMTSITDPDAFSWDPDILRVSTHQHQ
jgi:Diadenosine tetraphosphate (Ap4A) hydrolase and other HIT family hydrolases